VNLNYLDDIAERIRAEVPSAAMPDLDMTELFRLYAVLALALGPRVQLSDVHNAWVAWMLRLRPDHPALVPFTELTPAVQSQDGPYTEAIRRVALDMRLSPPIGSE
jgi:hypothetical protein